MKKGLINLIGVAVFNGFLWGGGFGVIVGLAFKKAITGLWTGSVVGVLVTLLIFWAEKNEKRSIPDKQDDIE